MTEVFVPSGSDVFGCDSEGLFILDVVHEWCRDNRKALGSCKFHYCIGGGVFTFDKVKGALMFKLTWGGR